MHSLDFHGQSQELTLLVLSRSASTDLIRSNEFNRMRSLSSGICGGLVARWLHSNSRLSIRCKQAHTSSSLTTRGFGFSAAGVAGRAGPLTFSSLPSALEMKSRMKEKSLINAVTTSFTTFSQPLSTTVSLTFRALFPANNRTFQQWLQIIEAVKKTSLLLPAKVPTKMNCITKETTQTKQTKEWNQIKHTWKL